MTVLVGVPGATASLDVKGELGGGGWGRVENGVKVVWRDKSAATHGIFIVGNSGSYASDMVSPCRADLFENRSVSKAQWRASGLGAAR